MKTLKQARLYFSKFNNKGCRDFGLFELEENVLSMADDVDRQLKELTEQRDKAEKRLLLFLKFAKQADLDYEDDIVFEDFEKFLSQLTPKEDA